MMKCYRVYFSFGSDDETDCRVNLVDAETKEQAAKLVAARLADDPDGFVIGKVEALD